MILRNTTAVDESASGPVRGVITLTYDQRTRSRLRARTDDGRDVALNVARGGVLRDGDRLADEAGQVYLVRAAPEPVSAAYAEDPLLLARSCYHLGNRHVAVQIDAGRVAWLADHVLDEMVRGLGLEPVAEQAPFDPEGGAYGHAHGGHGHDHHGAHGHDHGH